jgi:hypothetical protein
MLSDMQTQLQGEFNKINQRLDAHDARFDRLEARFERLEDDTRIGFDRVNTTLDGIAGRLDEDYTERVALTARVTRHEDWILAAAPVVKRKYVPGA